MPRRRRRVTLSNIRDMIGWIVGCKVVDVTAGDPPDLPDYDPEDAGHITLMFDNGGTLGFQGGDTGFWHSGDPATHKRRRPRQKAATRKRKPKGRGKR